MPKPKEIDMRDPKEIDKPLKMMRNTQTKLLRQATPEEIAGAIAKIDDDKKKAKKKAEAKKAEEAKKEKEEEPKEAPKDEAPKASAADDKKEETPKTEEPATSAADKAPKEEKASEAEKTNEAEKTSEAEKSSEADKTAIEQNFYWIKHAESTANLYNNEETDKYKDAGIQKELLDEKNEYRQKKKTGGAPGVPPLPPDKTLKPVDLIETDERTKMDPTIIELMNWLKEKTDEKKNPKTFDATWAKVDPFCQVNDEKYDPKVCSAKISDIKEETDRTLAYVKWLKQILFYWVAQPVLTPGGMVQARILGEQLKKKEIKPDTILCAATVPAMMTAYLTALYAELPDITIYPVPYVNDKENEAEIMFKGTNFHDYANYGIKPDDMAAVGALILRWFDTNQIYDATGMALENLKKENKPLFDYTYYQGGDELRNSATPEEFFKWIDTTPLKEKPNVWVFSYDTPIKAIRKQALAGAIDDSKNPNFWDTNTAVFQHKRQGTALQAIFPKDTPPKLTIPFPAELAECGLIYFPNAGVENTVIRSGKDVKNLLKMDITKDNRELLTNFYEAIMNITHAEASDKTKDKEAMYAQLTELYTTFNAIQPDTLNPPTELDTDPAKKEWQEAIQKSFKSDQNYIKIKYDSLTATKANIDDGKESFNQILEEELKEVTQLLIDLIQKYKDQPLPNDEKKRINEGYENKLKEQIDELNKLYEDYYSSPAKDKKDKDIEIKKKVELNKELARDKTLYEENKLTNDALTAFKKKINVAGGGGGSRKKRNRKAKKSVRNNRKKERKHKSKKKKRHVKKYTKRHHNL
jgi:hypothetical protein